MDYHDDYSQAAFLDLQSGEVMWVYEEEDANMHVGIPPEENAEIREKIKENMAEEFLREHGIDPEWTGPTEGE